MLNENLKKLRIAKGLSQEELAVKLNVVRQTISKWEKGLSVPDSEMLINIAKELDTSVNILLGENIDFTEHESHESEIKALAEKLELLNEQFALRNKTRRKILTVVFAVAGIISATVLLTDVIAFFNLYSVFSAIDIIGEDVAIIGGSDGPTSIIVSKGATQIFSIITTAAVLVISAIGLIKTRKS